MKESIRSKISDVIFIWQFAMDDFRAKYAGSILGGIWAFLQPIITIILYWFIFQLGFKSQPVKDFPFILWLVAGLVPWFFLSDAISNATSSMIEYSYLVKKVLFNINILPLAKIISSLLVHIVLIVFVAVVYVCWGYFPDLYYLQIPIYLIYMIVLTSGIVYLTSTLYVFFKDVIQVVSIALQIIFWLTPIVWELEAMPEIAKRILIFNPVYYVINGYRSIFVHKQWFGETVLMTVYYWGLAVFLLVMGLKLFSKCKDHFADVL